MGKECPYMLRKGQGFRNFAELKYTYSYRTLSNKFSLVSQTSAEQCMSCREYALRHLGASQCFRCGRKFGKPYALTRHMNMTKRCMKWAEMSTNPMKLEQVDPKLATAIVKLQEAKKEDIFPAITSSLYEIL